MNKESLFSHGVEFFLSNWYWLAPLILWVAARLIPTKKNYDLFEMFIKAVDKAIPNNRRKMGPFAVLLFAGLILATSGFAQVYNKAFQFNTVAADTATMFMKDGLLYWNPIFKELRLVKDGTKITIGGGVGGTVVATRVAYGAGANSLTNNASFVYAAGTGQLSVPRVVLSPSATLAGLNVGSVSGNPSTLSNGDIWYDGVCACLKFRANGSTQQFGTGSGNVTGNLVAGRIPLSNGATSIVDDPDLTFSTATNTLSTGRIAVAPTSTLPGLNVGVFGGNPSGAVNGDVWYNSSESVINMYFGASPRHVVNSTGTIGSQSVTFGSGANVSGIDGDAQFLYDAGNDHLTVPRISLQPSATFAGLQVGSIASNPSTLFNGNIWYNSATGNLMGRINGASVPLGLVNTFSATSNEVLKGNGSGGISGTGIYSSAPNGNLQLGDASIVGDRTILIESSDAQGDLIIDVDQGSVGGAGTFSVIGRIEARDGFRTQTGTGDYWQVKFVNIGDWNMDTTSPITVAHGLADYKKIRSVEVVIRDDADSGYFPLDNGNGSVSLWDATNVQLLRNNAGFFDGVNFDATSYNRGFLKITYVR